MTPEADAERPGEDEGSSASLGPAVGVPASKRALRSQGRLTMRKLLDSAMKVLDERGYHGTRVKDVVNRSNTSHGTFYLYFSNKEDLVRALTMEATSEASNLSYDAMVDAGSALDGESWDQLRGWIGDYSALWVRYAPLFRSWTDLATMDEAVGDQTRRMVTANSTKPWPPRSPPPIRTGIWIPRSRVWPYWPCSIDFTSCESWWARRWTRPPWTR